MSRSIFSSFSAFSRQSSALSSRNASCRRCISSTTGLVIKKSAPLEEIRCATSHLLSKNNASKSFDSRARRVEKYNKSTFTSTKIATPRKNHGGSISKRYYSTPSTGEYDVVLVGGGIMSASLGVFLQQLEPRWKIKMVETLGAPGEESSYAWNNAGTGHSALCELNYTPEDPTEGTIDISKAVKICEEFLVSRQWWSWLVSNKIIDGNANEFMNPTPHLTFVRGEKNVDYSKRRWELMKAQPVFKTMVYSEDFEEIGDWAPLLTEGRNMSESIAATRVAIGSDMNFGALTKKLVKSFEKHGGETRFNTECTSLTKTPSGWKVSVAPKGGGPLDGVLPNLGGLFPSLPNPLDAMGASNAGPEELHAKFVFVGAGGMTLPLLQLGGIPEIAGYGGFPVSGKFLGTSKKEITDKHWTKVYGKAAVGAPPMSVPHLDARYIDGKRHLLFGPFAGFAPNFTKAGSALDLLTTVNPWNVTPMGAAALQNMDLSLYMAKEMSLSHDMRMDVLREFMPSARNEDWELRTAGQRVQIMKEDSVCIGKIQFGTEIVTSDGGRLAGLMGASPGASVSTKIAVDVLQKCFPTKFADEWHSKLVEMMPGHGQQLNANPQLLEKVEDETADTLGLYDVEKPAVAAQVLAKVQKM